MTTPTIRDHCAALSGDVDYLIACIQDGSSDSCALQECLDRANTARDLLAAEPVGEEPSERIVSIAKAVQGCAHAWEPDALLIGSVCAEDVADLCDAVIARWGHPAAPPAPDLNHVEQLAAIIRQVDGDHTMGAAALAEAILERYPCAFLVDPPAAPPAPEVGEEQRNAVITAVTEALGAAYDCLRVWEAWSVGTMGEDDFALVAEDPDRVAEIADAAIEAIRPTTPPAPSERDVAEWINGLPLWHGATRDELTGIVLRAFARWGRPAAPPAPEVQRDAVIAAVTEALGGAEDVADLCAAVAHEIARQLRKRHGGSSQVADWLDGIGCHSGTVQEGSHD